MENSFDISSLIHKGGVFRDVEGSTPEEIYEKVCKMLDLPDSITSDQVYNALCAREKILSTAVGNGIALPHARTPIMKDESDQKICIVYLKEPLDMKAPDEKKVTVMFILLTQNSQTHLRVLSTLVGLFRKNSFRKLLEEKAGEAQLINAIRELD